MSYLNEPAESEASPDVLRLFDDERARQGADRR